MRHVQKATLLLVGVFGMAGSSFAMNLCMSDDPPPQCSDTTPPPSIPFSNVEITAYDTTGIEIPLDGRCVYWNTWINSQIYLTAEESAVSPYGLTITGTKINPNGTVDYSSTSPGAIFVHTIPTAGSPNLELIARSNGLHANTAGTYTMLISLRASGYKDTYIARSFTVNYCR